MAVINTKQFFILNLEYICRQFRMIQDFLITFLCRNPNEVQTRHTSRDVPLEQNCYIEDIAFNEDGNLLYVWATGLSQGWLLCYRVMEPLSIELEARTHYDFVSRPQSLSMYQSVSWFKQTDGPVAGACEAAPYPTTPLQSLFRVPRRSGWRQPRGFCS